MRAADGERRDRELNSRLAGEGEHAALWKQVLGVLLAAQDLKKNRNIGRDEFGAVDLEVRCSLEGAISEEQRVDRAMEAHEANAQVQRVVDASGDRLSWL